MSKAQLIAEDLFESEGRVVRSIVASAGEIIKSRQSHVVSLDTFFVDTRKYLASAMKRRQYYYLYVSVYFGCCGSG